MNKLFTTLLTIAALGIAMPAVAQDCTPDSADPEVSAGGFYVDNDLCQTDEEPCLWSIWVYQETNNIDGLQRGDEFVDNTCGGQIEADLVIF